MCSVTFDLKKYGGQVIGSETIANSKIESTYMHNDFTSYNGRISYLSGLNNADKYLEIGVWGGEYLFPS